MLISGSFALRYPTPIPCIARLYLCASHTFTLMQDSLRGGTFHLNAGISPYAGSPSTILLPKEAFGPPKSPSYPHECMPWSKTPVVSQAHRHSAPRTAAFRRMQSVGFPLPLHREIILLTTTKSISGLNTQPASLIHPASYSHYWVCTWTSLLTRRLHFDQVGLELQPALTHWVTISNFIPPFGNPNDLGLAWHEHPLICTSAPSESSTKCGGSVSRGKVII
jgi:hypothetical protein